MIYWKDYVKTPYLVVLVLFCASFGISILVNWKYGAGIADMKWMIWTGFLFFLLYMCDTKREKSSYKKEFHFFSHVLLLYSGGAAAVSLYLMQTLYHAKWFTSGNELMLAGFYLDGSGSLYRTRIMAVCSVPLRFCCVCIIA